LTLRLLCANGKRLIIHLAPPCSTFSRARDRSSTTKLRSSSHPAGLAWLNKEQELVADEANRIAEHALDFAAWAAKVLGAVVSFENPSGSYIWPFAESLKDLRISSFEDAVVSLNVSTARHTGRTPSSGYGMRRLQAFVTGARSRQMATPAALRSMQSSSATAFPQAQGSCKGRFNLWRKKKDWTDSIVFSRRTVSPS
jgi:hypothetical protein